MTNHMFDKFEIADEAGLFIIINNFLYNFLHNSGPHRALFALFIVSFKDQNRQLIYKMFSCLLNKAF